MKHNDTSHPSPLAAARIKALRTQIAPRGFLCLTAETYRELRWEGFTRRDVDRVLELMLAVGEIEIDTTHSALVVQIAKQAARQGDE